MACVACGYDAPADFAFCPKCGQRLAPAAAAAAPTAADAPADRRPATVMFADLSGFTSLAEALDPEEVRALQTELFDAMSTSIRQFDGFVEKYVGDAVMAVFGAPSAHDDDPERALRAALRMHEAVAALDACWRARLGRPLALHVGVHTGPVVAGQIGSARDAAYAVTGDTVNAAARLQHAAEPGQTLVGQTTASLVRHAFEFDAPVQLALKGKAQPMTACALRRARDTPQAARGLQAHGLASPLVGREQELADLMAAFDTTLGGQAAFVGIAAEAGTGKSRLLAAFLEAVESSGRGAAVSVRRAACSSLGERAFAVPAALLREAYAIAADDAPDTARHKIAQALTALGSGADEATQLAAMLGVVLGLEADASAWRHLDPEHFKQHVFAAVAAIVERRLQHGALLLAVEDLHWADAVSVELLRHLLEGLGDRRLMLLATYRPSPELDALAGASPAGRLLRLAPLSHELSATLLVHLFGRSAPDLPDALRARIVEQSGGNPLFLEEMVRTLIADGVLVRGRDGWAYRPRAGEVSVPWTIHGLLLGRVDRLPPSARRALLEASVIGPTFEEALLRLVTGEPQALRQALDTLVDGGLLVRQPPSDGGEGSTACSYRFSHGLFHEVSYQNLLARRRAELHTRIGEALERLCGGAPRQLQELQALGHHFRLGEDRLRGVRYLVAAGDWARRLYANADAIRQYELALETLSACGDPDGRRPEVEERLGDVLAPAGQIAAATQRLEEARAVYARTKDAVAEARVLRKIAALRWEGGERAEARSCLDAGLSLMSGLEAHIEHAKLHQELGHQAFRSGDHAAALQWTQRALDEVERLTALEAEATADDERERSATLALALNTQGAALARLDRLDEAVARLERSVLVARAADLPQVECRALSNLGVLYSTREPRRAIAACERGLQTAQRIGDVGLQSRLYSNLAVAYCTLTNRCDEKGVGAAQSAIDIDRRTGQVDHLAVSLVVLAQIHQCHGDPAQALAYYGEALALAEQSGEAQLLFPCYDGLATLHLDLDDGAAAGRYMQLARATCERAHLDPDTLIVLPFLA